MDIRNKEQLLPVSMGWHTATHEAFFEFYHIPGIGAETISVSNFRFFSFSEDFKSIFLQSPPPTQKPIVRCLQSTLHMKST